MGSINKMAGKAKTFWKTSVTLEPIITGYFFAFYMLDGSKITTNLLITKVCNLTGFENQADFIDCANLTWVAEQDEVMTQVNDFQVTFRLRCYIQKFQIIKFCYIYIVIFLIIFLF